MTTHTQTQTHTHTQKDRSRLPPLAPTLGFPTRAVGMWQRRETSGAEERRLGLA